jgi:hypothetical protein
MTILTPPRETDFGASALPKIIEPWSANPTGEARGLAAESGRGLDFSPRLAPAVTASPDIAAPDTSSVSPQLVSAPPAGTLPRSPEKQFRIFTLIDPNRLWVMVVAIALLGGILAASLVSSFTSVYAMAAWVGLPAEVQWLPVVILDVAIVGFSWALMVFSTRAADEAQRARDSLRAGVNSGNDREKTARTRLLLIWVTGFSVIANFMHTYDYWDGDLSTPQAITGAVFSASIPLMAFGATEELIRLVFIRRKRVNVKESE